MLIDLSKLLTHEGKQQQVEILPSGDTFSCELGEFSYGENEPVLLTIKHKENQILNICARGQVAVWIPCSRCLEPVLVSCPVDYDEEIDISCPRKNGLRHWMKAVLSRTKSWIPISCCIMKY